MYVFSCIYWNFILFTSGAYFYLFLPPSPPPFHHAGLLPWFHGLLSSRMSSWQGHLVALPLISRWHSRAEFLHFLLPSLSQGCFWNTQRMLLWGSFWLWENYHAQGSNFYICQWQSQAWIVWAVGMEGRVSPSLSFLHGFTAFCIDLGQSLASVWDLWSKCCKGNGCTQEAYHGIQFLNPKLL